MASEPSGDGPSSVVLRGVQKHYRRGDEDIPAATDINLRFDAGALICILGPSGGGKSTLLHLIGGMDRPNKGEILVRGRDITQLSADGMAAYRRTEVGFVFQSFHLLPALTALENVELPLAIAGAPPPVRRSRAEVLLGRVGLLDRKDHRPSQLSGGQAQRVAIARALAADPPVVLADEPTGNLDTHSGREIMGLLRSIAHEDGRTVIAVTHNEEFIPYADRVVRIRDGRVQSDESQGERPVGPVRGTLPAARVAGTVRPRTVWGMALSAVRRRLGRAVLTGLGIAVGVAMTVLLMGLGSGLELGAVKGLTTFGPLTSITVSPQSVSGVSSPFAQNVASGKSTPITVRSLARLGALPGVRGVYATALFFATIKAGANSIVSSIQNLPPANLNDVAGIRPSLVAGTWPKRGGIILSDGVAKALEGGVKPDPKALVGRLVSVTLQGMTGGVFTGGTGLTAPPQRMPAVELRVSGIASASTGYVSYGLAVDWIRGMTGSGELRYPGATAIANSISDVSQAAARIRRLGYGVTTVEQILKSITASFSAVEIGLGVIGGVALVVAGLMIGVIMSMAVLERRREIGILRAVGARQRDVAALFLAEVAAIGVGGGVIGLALGAGAGLVTNAIVESMTHSSTGIFRLPVWLVVLGLVFGAAVALFAGWIPSARAARLNPVDALRSE